MPQYRNPFEKGDLYIKFDVQFPENNWINPDKLSVSILSKFKQWMTLSSIKLCFFVTFHLCLVLRLDNTIYKILLF